MKTYQMKTKPFNINEYQEGVTKVVYRGGGVPCDVFIKRPCAIVSVNENRTAIYHNMSDGIADDPYSQSYDLLIVCDEPVSKPSKYPVGSRELNELVDLTERLSVASKEPQHTDFTFETFPKGMVWVKDDWNIDYLVIRIQCNGVMLGGLKDFISFSDLHMKYNKISLDGRKTWQVAGVKK